MAVPSAYQFVIMVFIGTNPSWRCLSQKNISEFCVKNGKTFSVGDEFYKQRCSMPRSNWEYTKPASFSIVTKVKKLFVIQI